MEGNSKKILTVSFVIAAILVAFVVGILLDTAAATFGVFARFMDYDVVRHGIPVISGLIAFLILQFHKKTFVWADEVVVELKKVVWPSKKDTTAMTIVVCIMLVISAIVLGTFDIVAGYLVNFIIR